LTAPACALGASPARQFDALIQMDLTRAIEPLERAGGENSASRPKTYLTAL
jgi:hypothetical protein